VLPAHTFESLIDDPHLQDIGSFQQFEYPTEGVPNHGGAQRVAADAAAAAAPVAAARPAARKGWLMRLPPQQIPRWCRRA
jgi:hypothetical protein